jgi:hypothetical protein
MKFRGKRIFFEKTGFIFHISHIVLVVYIPYLTKTPLKKRRLHSCPCKILPVVLVADGQSKLIEADHPPDEGTSKVFIGTKSSTSELQYALKSLNAQAVKDGRKPSHRRTARDLTPQPSAIPARRATIHPGGKTNHQNRW